MNPQGCALIQNDCCPYKKRLQHRHTERKDYVKTEKTTIYKAKERGLGRNQTLGHLDLRLLASRIVRKISIVEDTRLWYFVLGALAN